MRWRVSSPKSCRTRSAAIRGRQSRRRRRHARHARGRDAPRRTATRCCSATPGRSRSIRPLSAGRHRSAKGFRRRSAWSPSCRSRCSRIHRFRRRRSANSSRCAKKDPGKLNVGTSAVGTGGYMTRGTVQVRGRHRVSQIIPYKGTAPRHERSARRSRAGRVRRAAAGARQHQGRQTARHRASPA